MNVREQFMITASGSVLSKNLPDDFESDEDFNIEDFINENTWEPLEHLDASTILDIISGAADNMLRARAQTISDISEQVAKLEVGLFAKRGTVDEAIEFGLSMFQGGQKAAASTAMMVMYNTAMVNLAAAILNDNDAG